MFNISCDKCGFSLEADYEATMKDYIDSEYDYRVFNDGILDESIIQDYIIFVCRKCGERYKFTYKDWEARYRHDIIMSILEVKKRKAFSKLNPTIINESNGIGFCGQCTGSEGNGYCLKDIIKQCSVRK